MKLRTLGMAATALCLLLPGAGAYAQVETVTASVGYWNYQVSPTQVTITDQNNPAFPSGIGNGPSVFADFIGQPQIGTARALASIDNIPVTIGGPLIQAFLETTPTIDLSATATSTFPAANNFQGPTANLPLASATAKISDSIKFCVGGSCDPINIGNIKLSALGTIKLRVDVSYHASLQSINGSNVGAAVGTSMSLNAGYGLAGTSLAIINQGMPDFNSTTGRASLFIELFNPSDVNTFKPFSFLTDISASPFEDGSETVTFSDPISLALLDGDGNPIPGLIAVSQNGFFYGVTDGLLSVIPDGSIVTPIPTALPLFASGLGSFGLLVWRRKRKTVRESRPSTC